MYMHNKRLMYTVRVGSPDPRLANLILEQFGAPDGELAAAMRYFTQGLAESDPGRKDLLLDIATEELSHLEVVGNIVTMLNQGVKCQMAKDMDAAELLANISGGTDSHTTALLYGGGVALTNSAACPGARPMSIPGPSLPPISARISLPKPAQRSFTSGSLTSAMTPT